MTLKQISLTIPENLYNESKEYCKEFGYKNIQELALDLMRHKVMMERIEEYKELEREMDKAKVKTYSQKEAIKHIRGL